MTENALVTRAQIICKFLAASKDDDDWDWSYEDNSTYGSCD